MDDGRLARTMGMAIGAIGPIVVAGALVGIRDSIANADVALLLVLVVVLAAVTGGWQAGAVGAGVAALSFDFFHTKPYLSLTIDSRDDTVTAALLLLVGISVGLLAGRARDARAAARSSSSEIDRIHRVAELAAHGASGEDVLLSAQDELKDLLDLQQCRFEAPAEPARARHRRTERHRDRHDRPSLLAWRAGAAPRGRRAAGARSRSADRALRARAEAGCRRLARSSAWSRWRSPTKSVPRSRRRECAAGTTSTILIARPHVVTRRPGRRRRSHRCCAGSP